MQPIFSEKKSGWEKNHQFCKKMIFPKSLQMEYFYRGAAVPGETTSSGPKFVKGLFRVSSSLSSGIFLKKMFFMEGIPYPLHKKLVGT